MSDDAKNLERLVSSINDFFGAAEKAVSSAPATTEGQLSGESRRAIVAALASHQERWGLSDRDVARGINIAPSTLSQLKAGAYGKVKPATLDGHLRKINEWVELDERRRRTTPQQQFVITGVADAIIKTAKLAAEECLIALASGPTGIGKSMTAAYLASTFPGAMLVRCGQNTRTHAQVRNAVADAAFGPSRRASERHTADRLFAHLRGSNRPLILDEAHRLRDDALDFVRDLYDECKLPIVLLCTVDLWERILAGADEDHGQFRGRVGYVIDILAESGRSRRRGADRKIFSVDEIRRMFGTPKLRLSRDAVDYLTDIANTMGQGSLRACHNLIRLAARRARTAAGVGLDDPVELTGRDLYTMERRSLRERRVLEDVAARAARVGVAKGVA